MEMRFEQLATGGLMVVLAGRMDIAGAMEMELQFAAAVSAQKAVIVDLAAVPFIASMGLRALILGAKSMHSKGGKMVLLNPVADVAAVLSASGTDTLIPVAHDRAEAQRLASAA